MSILKDLATIFVPPKQKDYKKQKIFYNSTEQKTNWIENFKSEVEKYKTFIQKRKYITTPSEWKFFERLTEFAYWKGVLIFTKVRVWDIIEVKNFSNGNRKFSISSRLDRSHFDFVAVEKATMRIICAIELDDPSHLTKTAQERDEIKDFICNFVWIPLIRFNKISPTDEEFKVKWL